MSLPSASVRRPVFATMVTLMVVALGVVAFGRLRIDLLPEVEMPSCTIRTNYDGASPEVVERLVTQILEEIVATVPGVQEIESQSLEGSSRVTVRFGYGVDLDAERLTAGALLEMDPATERFTNDPRANRMLRRDYRAPFVVPDEV